MNVNNNLFAVDLLDLLDDVDVDLFNVLNHRFCRLDHLVDELRHVLSYVMAKNGQNLVIN